MPKQRNPSARSNYSGYSGGSDRQVLTEHFHACESNRLQFYTGMWDK